MGPPIPLVGREDALAELRNALAQAEDRRGLLVVVSGEPGIGKSALADLIGREATARGALVVFGRAWELAEAPPYFPVWGCLRSLGIEPPQGAAVEADTFHLWERVLEALGRAAASRPVVWILEDLHAADLLTLDLLTFLARPLRALGVLLLVTLRDRDPRIGNTTAARIARLCRDGDEIRLGLLGPAEVRTLAEAVAGRALTPASVRQLCELTGGNPLFVLECARAFEATTPTRLPASVRELTVERVALLDEGTREALACGAIVGRDFTAAVVARMLGWLPAQVIERLTGALRAGMLLEMRPGQFRFSHILVRDAIEEALPAGRRAELHAHTERALATERETVDVLVERARHALASMTTEGDPIGLALRAARELTTRGAHDRALALYERIEEAYAAGLVTARPDGEEALQRAATARAAGRHADARRRCDDVVAAARATRDGVLMAHAALEMGAELRPATVDGALVAALREAMTLLPADARVPRCRVQARLAGALQPADDPAVPMAMARAAIAEARALGDPALLLEVLQTAGAALVDMAPLDERLALGVELRDRAAAAGDAPRTLLALTRLALDHAEAGDFAGFDDDVNRARESSVKVGHPRRRWRPLFLESMRAIARGDFELSERCLVEIEQHATLTDDPALTASLLAHRHSRAVLFHRDADVRAGLGRIEESMAGVPHVALLAACIRMGALVRMEDAAGAAREAAHIRGRVPFETPDLRFLLAESSALIGTHDERRAVRNSLLPVAEQHLVSGHVPMTYEGPCLRVLALLDSALGEHDAAVARLRRARDGARERGHAPWVAQLAYDLGRVLAAAGRATEAASALEEAATGAEALGMPGLAARARSRLHANDVRAATAPGVAAAPDPVSRSATLTLAREGDVWRVDADSRSVRVRHSRGIALLARLVERPGDEIHVLALASDTGASLPPGEGDADGGEMLDAQARRAYKTRLSEIEAALGEAEAAHDLGRSARLTNERELLLSELSRAVGLGGRARPNASASERARVNVQRRLKEAIARIGDADAELGAALLAAVHTGTYCCFRP